MNLEQDTKAIEQGQRITAYLKGQMSKEEESQFLQELERDVTLRSQAVSMARMANAMRIVGAEKDTALMAEINALGSEEQVKAMLSSFDFGNKGAARRSFALRKTILSISAAACVLCCIWGAYRLYDNHQMAVLGTEYLPCFPSSTYSRGESNGVDDVQSRLDSLYQSVEKKDNVESAIKELEKMWRQSLKDEYNDYTEYSSQIGWILANAYIIQNEKTQAVQVLDAIIGNRDSTPALEEKAVELKKKVESKTLF